MTVKVIFNEVQFQTKKSNSHFVEYQFLGLKFFDFSLLNRFETLIDVIASPKPLASDEFDSFYNNGYQYRPVWSIKKFKNLEVLPVKYLDRDMRKLGSHVTRENEFLVSKFREKSEKHEIRIARSHVTTKNINFGSLGLIYNKLNFRKNPQ